MNIETFTYYFQYNAKFLRVNNQMSQQKVADSLGINQKSIGAIEEGRALGVEKLYAYSSFFDVPINDLISRKLTKSDIRPLKTLAYC